MTDPAAWKYSKEEKGGALELAAQSKYKPEVRSPVNISLIKDKVFGDFILEVDLIQTGREYGHRDMCLFFGFQNPKQFYYAHIATKADPNAHNVFIVNNEPRKNIAKTTTTGVNWGLNIWHKVKLERKVSDGSINVYFDDMTIPIMVAEDKNFGPRLRSVSALSTTPARSTILKSGDRNSKKVKNPSTSLSLPRTNSHSFW